MQEPHSLVKMHLLSNPSALTLECTLRPSVRFKGTLQHLASSAPFKNHVRVHPSISSASSTLRLSAPFETQPRVHPSTLRFTPFGTEPRVHPSAHHLKSMLLYSALSISLDTRIRVHLSTRMFECTPDPSTLECAPQQSVLSAPRDTHPRVHPLALSASLGTQVRVHLSTVGLKCTPLHLTSSVPFDTQVRVHPLTLRSTLSLNCTLQHLGSNAPFDNSPRVHPSTLSLECTL
ncbi:hypothetical protein VNO78_05583 [Psophocarpus tetragonolobus]|uniref:Uncharacterized protein n=1 Tax=Psophocarpus tetragonolobus TaxID=3891 RepID=A0AAN9SZY0_PSOTE